MDKYNDQKKGQQGQQKAGQSDLHKQSQQKQGQDKKEFGHDQHKTSTQNQYGKFSSAEKDSKNQKGNFGGNQSKTPRP